MKIISINKIIQLKDYIIYCYKARNTKFIPHFDGKYYHQSNFNMNYIHCKNWISWNYPRLFKFLDKISIL